MDYWLMQGDCLERMDEIPDGSVDMVLCDLPYGMTDNHWDTIIPFEPLWDQYHRIVKLNGAIVLNCMQPFTSALIMSNRKDFRYVWYWDKHSKSGFLQSKNRPLKQIEEVAVFYRKQCLFSPPRKKRARPVKIPAGKTCSANYGDSYKREGIVTITDTYCASTLITDYPKPVFRKGHPTEKPTGLLEYLIRTYTSAGETVLDNCMGSGSTGVACANINRRFIGIEKDPRWFSVASARIAKAHAEGRMIGNMFFF